MRALNPLTRIRISPGLFYRSAMISTNRLDYIGSLSCSPATFLYYNVFHIPVSEMVEKTAVVTVRLSPRELEKIEAIRSIQRVSRTALIRDFIEDGLHRRVIDIYKDGKLTATKAAEILDISLREFLETLERAGTPVNWDSEIVKDYIKTRYGR